MIQPTEKQIAMVVVVGIFVLAIALLVSRCSAPFCR
jgi:hypothetical protein